MALQITVTEKKLTDELIPGEANKSNDCQGGNSQSNSCGRSGCQKSKATPSPRSD